MIKDIIGYEGLYGIDEMGNVYSYWFGKVKKLKAADDVHGYLKVVLCNDGIRKTCRVHRLMAKTFLPNYSEDLDVDHIDRNKTNNKISNLRMLPHQQNMFNNNAKGYTWDKNKDKWKAQIKINGKNINLGYFKKEDEAKAAYLMAKERLHVIGSCHV